MIYLSDEYSYYNGDKLFQFYINIIGTPSIETNRAHSISKTTLQNTNLLYELFIVNCSDHLSFGIDSEYIIDLTLMTSFETIVSEKLNTLKKVCNIESFVLLNEDGGIYEGMDVRMI